MKNFKILILTIALTLTTCNLGFAINNEFKLMPLPYSYDALDPYIDKDTMIIHHTKHHQNYVDNLNKIITSNPKLSSKSLNDLLTNLDTLPSNVKQGIINNAGGVYNHNFFWSIMDPNQSDKPIGNLATEIDKTFGSFDNFKSKFKDSAMSRFGSGWTWLVSDKNGNLSIISTSNQDSPISLGLTPIIGIDVWEHAYYLKYKNKRSDYVDNWWSVVNWNQANKNFIEK